MQGHLKGKSDIMKAILINEDRCSSPKIKTIAIDIETSMIGRDMNALLNTFTGMHSISPYSDVSLRVLIRIADMLMCRHVCNAYQVDPMAGVDEELVEHYTKTYEELREGELKYWVDKQFNYLDLVEARDKGKDGEFTELKKSHGNFTLSNGVA